MSSDQPSSDQLPSTKSSSSSVYTDDEIGIIEIMKSMGISNFDPMVPVALNEYARRFIAELLCDAKDYSVHANKNDIDAEDVKLAVQLCDVHVHGVDQSQGAIEEIKLEINKQSLVDFADPNAVLLRYPLDAPLQRSYTYVPGKEAYGPLPNDINNANTSSTSSSMNMI